MIPSCIILKYAINVVFVSGKLEEDSVNNKLFSTSNASNSKE